MAELVLVMGFAGYGGRGRNPAGEVASALDGRTIAGFTVAGRVLPVSYDRLRASVHGLLEELTPRLAIGLGLWPGESVIRLERIGINVADFEIPDNEGTFLTDVPVSGNDAPGRLATLPLRGIETALLQAGIPARISSTAGTFLCNAALYTLLSHTEALASKPLAGFIHLPYLPEQVAELLESVRHQRQLEIHQRSDTASMDLATMIHAVEIAIKVAARSLPRAPRRP
jgi:pyroglutamyl-peptidase